jgi:hypothetical protein
MHAPTHIISLSQLLTFYLLYLFLMSKSKSLPLSNTRKTFPSQRKTWHEAATEDKQRQTMLPVVTDEMVVQW